MLKQGRRDRNVIRIMIVSPTLAFRAGLRALLGDPALANTRDIGQMADDPGLEVVGEASDLVDTSIQGVDVLLITGDIGTEVELEQLSLLSERGIAMLLLSDDPQDARRLLGVPFRAWGILSLDSSAEELAAAVRAVHEGLLVGVPSLVESIFSNPLSLDGVDLESQKQPLTKREVEVLQLLAIGLANKQIALELGISEHTVKFHLSSIYAKLGATNRAEAVRLGIKQGQVPL